MPLAPTHLPCVFLLLRPYRDDHHLDRGEPQGPVGKKRKGTIHLVLAIRCSCRRSEKEIHRIRRSGPKA